MSIRDVRNLTQAMLADGDVGLAARIQALAGTGSAPALAFVPWKLATTMQPSTQANVAILPVDWQPNLKRVDTIRDALVQLRVSYETFGADVDGMQEEILIAATALAQVLDGIRDYSDAHQGTVIDLVDPITYQFGQFDGGTSAGFTATFTIEERASS